MNIAKRVFCFIHRGQAPNDFKTPPSGQPCCLLEPKNQDAHNHKSISQNDIHKDPKRQLQTKSQQPTIQSAIQPIHLSTQEEKLYNIQKSITHITNPSNYQSYSKARKIFAAEPWAKSTMATPSLQHNQTDKILASMRSLFVWVGLFQPCWKGLLMVFLCRLVCLL